MVPFIRRWKATRGPDGVVYAPEEVEYLLSDQEWRSIKSRMAGSAAPAVFDKYVRQTPSGPLWVGGPEGFEALGLIDLRDEANRLMEREIQSIHEGL